jgi:hypothetical protein
MNNDIRYEIEYALHDMRCGRRTTLPNELMECLSNRGEGELLPAEQACLHNLQVLARAYRESLDRAYEVFRSDATS